MRTPNNTKEDKARLTRRSFIGSSALLAIGGLSTSFLTNTETTDGTTDEGVHKTYVRLMGSLEPATIYKWFSGHLWGIVPGEAPKPIATFEGIAKEIWNIDGDKYTKESFDMGFFGDLETGEVLESMMNPYNQKEVDVFHFMYGGGSTTKYSAAGVDSGGTIKAIDPKWIYSGDQVTFDEYSSASFKNPIPSKDFPLSSAGDHLHFGSSTTYIANRNKIIDPQLASAPHSFFWTAVNSWEPWLHMGQTPGYVMWRATGHKLHDISEASDRMRAYVKAVQPNYFDEGRPWEGRRSTYTSYMKARKGKE